MTMDETIGSINAAKLKTSNEFKNTVDDMMKNTTPVILPTNGRDDELIEIIAMLKCDISYITREVSADGKKKTMIVLMGDDDYE
ncbi:hypothetical protein [Clostridium sp. HGF2]|uniref:hypothetical protein n=1 Tax=Clostridium sp. HGF2 TaxID=908340 RepID=UPI0001EB1F8A|nr:hypothetical protein HMPREF9406_2582 [Clostridium sp. HGF2]DAY62779.1 MAG TPA: hypothetical protein [Caudoviricetes sp.]